MERTTSGRDIEVEAKFALPDQRTRKRLRAQRQLAGLAAGPWSVQRVTDTYFDTPHRAILAADLVCRLRRRETGLLLTVKALRAAAGALHTRAEHEIELDPALDPAAVAHWPIGPARALIESAAGGQPLFPLLEIRQTRHRCELLDGRRPVAELSLDQVRFESGKLLLEVEVELLPEGTRSDIERIAGVLQTDWGLCPLSTSKFERALESMGPVGDSPRRDRTGIEPADPMSEAGRKIWRQHFDRMRAHEPGTRSGQDIEELHDMRVATRRMRAAFRIFARYFHRQSIQPYLEGLRQTGRALGRVRDLDVFEFKARSYLAALPEAASGSLAGLISAWHLQQAAAREQMVAFLDGAAYAGFVEEFDRFLSTPGLGALPARSVRAVPYQVRHVVPHLIYRRYEAVRAYEPLLEAAAVELLHALRIDFKRLRYTLEFFLPVLGPTAAGVIEEVKGVQDHLGDLNDAAVAIRLLDEHLPANQQDQAGVAAYLQHCQAEESRLLQTFPAVWERFNSPELRRNLAAAVAAL